MCLECDLTGNGAPDIRLIPERVSEGPEMMVIRDLEPK